MLELVERAAAELEIPFTVGGGIAGLEDARGAAPRRARTRSRSTAPRSTTRSCSPRSPTSSARRRSSARSTRAPARSSPTAAATPRGLDAVAWAQEAVDRGAGEILLTSIDADGTRDGYDLELTRAVAGAVSVPVIASGGAGEATHLAEAFEAGAEAALVASIVHERPERLPELKRELKEAGWPITESDPRDRPGRRRRARADARLDGRGGAPPHARDRRGVVLEPLARRALAQGRDLRRDARRRGDPGRLRRRRDPPARPADRPRLPHRARSPASRRGSGAASPSARRSGPRARTSRACSTRARRRPPGRSARRASRPRSPAWPRATSAWSRSSPISGSTATSCSRPAGSTRPRSRTSSGVGTVPQSGQSLAGQRRARAGRRTFLPRPALSTYSQVASGTTWVAIAGDTVAAAGAACARSEAGVRPRSVAAGNRDVELGVAPHAVLVDVEAAASRPPARPGCPTSSSARRGSANDAPNVNAPTATSPSAWTPSWWKPPP